MIDEVFYSIPHAFLVISNLRLPIKLQGQIIINQPQYKMDVLRRI